MTTDNQTVTEEELKAGATKLGQKLAVLVAVLFPKEEEQRAMLAVAEKMTPAQLMEFIETLENKYLELATGAVDEKFVDDINQLKDSYQAQQADSDQRAIEALDQIAKELTD